jgi:hypothetical protein
MNDLNMSLWLSWGVRFQGSTPDRGGIIGGKKWGDQGEMGRYVLNIAGLLAR